jgi:hypothetical protein
MTKPLNISVPPTEENNQGITVILQGFSKHIFPYLVSYITVYIK